MGRSNQWRRESFIPFNFLQNELARVLEDYFQPEVRGGGQSPPTDLEPSGWSPLIDVYETPEDTIVVAEIPGVDPTKIEPLHQRQLADPPRREGNRRAA